MIAVVGAGAIGGLLAAELIAAGRTVTLCARSPLERLVVERAEHPRDVEVTVATSPAQVATADWVVVALKGPRTASSTARTSRPTSTARRCCPRWRTRRSSGSGRGTCATPPATA
jgi:ketopantoate reductase